MVKIFNLRNWKKEKGLTLAEVVIAIAIIVIVSLATVSVSVYSSNVFRSIEIKDFFVREIDTISTLYLNYDETNFSNVFNFYTGQVVEGYTDVTYYVSSGFEYVDSSNYSYSLSLDFSSGSLSISSLKKNGNVIYERTVTK